MKILSLRDYPDMAWDFIRYFQKQWATPDSRMVYEDCMLHCLNAPSPLPQWYLLKDGEKTAGCAGLITNDFISRGDLWPWLCALYVEPAYRGHAYGNLLISHAKQEARRLGYSHLYLCTDHVGYYEKYGFSYLGPGYHPWGETSRVYGISLDGESGGLL